MFRHILFFVITLSGAGAHASRSCHELLASINTIKTEASDSVTAYVRLIEFYFNKNSDAIDTNVLRAILDAESFINPFENKKDSLSLLLSAGIKKTGTDIDQKKWSEIKSAVAKLVKNTTAMQSDRIEKENDTSLMFDPKIVSENKNEAYTSESHTVQEVGGRTLLLMGESDYKLRVYELIDGKFKHILVTPVQSPTRITAAKWQVVDGRFILALSVVSETSGRGLLQLYELVENRLEHLEEYNTISSARSIEWQAIGKRTLLVTGGSELYFFEFVNSRLKLLDFQIEATGHVSPSWNIIDSRAYLTVTSNEEIRIFDLEKNKLSLRSSFNFKAVIKSPYPDPPGRTGHNVLRFYNPHVALYTSGGRTYITLIGAATDARFNAFSGLVLFELKDNQIIFKKSFVLSSYEPHKSTAHTARPWTLGDKTLLPIQDNKALYLYEIEDEELILNRRFDIKSSAATLITIIEDDGAYIKLFGLEVTTVKVFKKFKK